MSGIFIPNTHGLITLLTLILTVCPSFSFCYCFINRIFCTLYTRGFWWARVTNVFRFLWYVFVLFVLVMCSLYPMLPVSLYFQFLVTPSVFAKSKFWSDGNLFVLFQAYTWYSNYFVCQSKNSYICSHVWPILKDSCKITYYFIH